MIRVEFIYQGIFFRHSATMRNSTLAIREVSKQTRSLPPTDDNTNIALRVHDTHTHPLFEESRSFCGLGIRFDRVLHQKKSDQSFHLLLSEMSSRKRKRETVSTTEVPRANSDSHLPSHIETPPPYGMVWFITVFPCFVNFFCAMYLVGMYSSGRSWISGSRCTLLIEHTISSPRLNVYPPNSLVSVTALIDMEDVVKRRVS